MSQSAESSGVGRARSRLQEHRRKPSPARSAASEATPAANTIVRNLGSAFSRRDSDAASLCSDRPASSVGGRARAAPGFSDRAAQAAALRVVNDFLAPAVALRGPLPATRDIQAALRLLLDRLRLPYNDVTFEDDLIQDLRDLGCPYKVTRAALRAPGTPHAWPTLLSVLHWLALLVSSCSQGDNGPAEASSAQGGGPPNSFLLYTTQGYCSYLWGHDAAVAILDEEYASKARLAGEATAATFHALEKEAQELEADVKELTSGPSQLEVLETLKEAFIADAQKFEAMVEIWETKVIEREQALGDLEEELDAKVSDAMGIAAEIQVLLGQVGAQTLDVRDVERMHREMKVVEDDIANAEKGSSALEDKVWELETKLVTKLEDLERLAEQCNQALKRLKPGIAFQYMINAKGSSPADMLGTGYKTVLKHGLVAHAEENKRIYLSKLEELNDLQQQMQGNVKVLEEEKDNISSLQATNDEMVARLNLLDREISNDDSRFTSDSKEMKDELEKKKNCLISAQMQADDFLKTSEKRLQDATLKADEETQMAASDLLELVDSMAEYKQFMETIISQRRKDLYETAGYIASLASRCESASQPSTRRVERDVQTGMAD